MPTNYNSADFSQLYSQYKQSGGVDDFKRLSSIVDLGENCRSFSDFDVHMESLDLGCSILDKRRGYLKTKMVKVNKLLGRVKLADDLDELSELHRLLNAIAVELYLKGSGVCEILSLITDYRHQLTRRVISIVSTRLAPQPCEFAWFNMGSDGRREQTFFTDQDNALVYEKDNVTEVDAYFENFANEMVHALDRVGFALCSGNIMPSNPDWRGSLEDWQRKLEDIFHDQSRDKLLRVIILMDITFCAGSEVIGQRMIDKVHKHIQDNPAALMIMAKSAIESDVALTMFKNLRLEKEGDHKGKFNVKLYGWAPLIMTARLFALKYGYEDTNTVERIKHLKDQNHFDEEYSRELQDAYRLLTDAKMVSQIEAIVSDREYDYFLDPETLNEDEQSALEQALSSVEALQKLAQNSFFGGAGM